MADASKKIILVGVDDSAESSYSLEWTLDHVLLPMKGSSETSFFKIILLHIKPPASQVVRLAGPGSGDMITRVESDINLMASSVGKMAAEICEKKSFKDFEVQMMEGDARELLCKAVDKHKAEMLVVGSHGYGAFKRAVLGSVSDYCAHHAHCSVLIVKKPKSTAQ
ncbi:universal stress protein A-like protein [Aristolochia californica]|uniref:universal stress protein A-like protein n=1 Tax=Aristolochia californica TaxID=171875 RepID=UPI0035DE9BDD